MAEHENEEEKEEPFNYSMIGKKGPEIEKKLSEDFLAAIDLILEFRSFGGGIEIIFSNQRSGQFYDLCLRTENGLSDSFLQKVRETFPGFNVENHGIGGERSWFWVHLREYRYGN